jgi:hypothetical protein
LRPAPRFHHVRAPVEPLGFSGQQFLRNFLTDQGRYCSGPPGRPRDTGPLCHGLAGFASCCQLMPCASAMAGKPNLEIRRPL